MADYLLFTCEHGGNVVPPRYRALFSNLLRESLNTHAGYDLGALEMARRMSKSVDAQLVASTTTRLLVDLNRSAHHPRLHAESIRKTSPEAREQILAEYYLPYRTNVETLVRKAVARGRRVIHVSSHSFTPELHGKIRNADVGLLYDPSRAGEVRMCRMWQSELALLAPHLRVRRNYPYAGKDDGFMPYLRARFRPAVYVGIELELNQAIVLGPRAYRARTQTAIVDSLRAMLAKA